MLPPPEEAQARLTAMAAEAVRLFSRAAVSMLERKPPEMADIQDFTCKGATKDQNARLYAPFPEMPPGPGLLFFHGGGFIADSIDTHDSLCRHLAIAARMRIISVNYRLAPQDLFPCAYEDALAIWDDISLRVATFDIEADELAVGGDSAGGNLAAGVALSRPTSRLLLLYPWLTLTVENLPSPNFKEGHLAGRSARDLCAVSYLGPDWQTLSKDFRASPLLATDLSNIKGADIVTGGWDPVRHDGALFADRLKAARIDVTIEHYDDLVHGGLSFPSSVATAARALEQVGRAFGKALGTVA